MKKTSSSTKHGQEKARREETVAVHSRALDLSNALVLAGRKLSKRPDIPAQSNPVQARFKSAEELKEIIRHNTGIFFGENTILLTPVLELSKGFIPFGFLFDLKKPADPVLHVISLLFGNRDWGKFHWELAGLLAFLKRQESRQALAEMLDEFVRRDREQKKTLISFDIKAIPEFLHRSLDNIRVLLISDTGIPGFGESDEAFEIWSIRVRHILVRKYQDKKEAFITLSPAFDTLRGNTKESIVFSEQYHLERCGEPVREIYLRIKEALLKAGRDLQFNPQKHYVSLKITRTLAFFHLRRKSLYLVLMLPEKAARKALRHHLIKSLPDSVKRFWNGDCCAVFIERNEHLHEVINLIKGMIRNT